MCQENHIRLIKILMNLQAYCFRKLFVLEVITLNVLFKIKYGKKSFLKIRKSGTKTSYFSANRKMCDLILKFFQHQSAKYVPWSKQSKSTTLYLFRIVTEIYARKKLRVK